MLGPSWVVGEPIYALGLDPGFASFGWAIVRLFPERERVAALGVIETKKSPKKLSVRAADDNSVRTRIIAEALQKLVERYHPKVIAAEAFSQPRNASVSGKLGRAWGAVDTLSVFSGLPVIQASPQAIKKALCGKQNASKDEVQEALRVRYSGQFDSYTERTPKGKWEHPFDAVGAVVACLDSEVMRMAKVMS